MMNRGMEQKANALDLEMFNTVRHMIAFADELAVTHRREAGEIAAIAKSLSNCRPLVRAFMTPEDRKATDGAGAVIPVPADPKERMIWEMEHDGREPK